MRLSKENKRILYYLALITYQDDMDECRNQIVKLIDKIKKLDLDKSFKTIAKYLIENEDITYNQIFEMKGGNK